MWERGEQQKDKKQVISDMKGWIEKTGDSNYRGGKNIEEQEGG